MFEYLVIIAALLSSIANFPQIHKIIKNKRAKDLSVQTLTLWSIITFILLIHAIEIKDIYFIISNIGMFIVDVILLYLAFLYK